jgi:hypothetical protein
MKKIMIAACFLVNFIFPLKGFSEELKWSDVIYIKGAGATNCGKTRITNEAWDQCEAFAKQNKGIVIKDIELYNVATENEKGTSWDPKLSCTFHANVKCGYSAEKGVKLKLTGLLKPKETNAVGCGTPVKDDEVLLGKCEDKGAGEKLVSSAKPTGKAAAAIQTVVIAAPSLPKNTDANPVEQNDKAKEGTVFSVGATGSTFKRSGLISIKGTGDTTSNCEIPRITTEALKTCNTWAKKKKGLSGKPVIKGVELYNIATENKTWADSTSGCSFHAGIKCRYTLDESAKAETKKKTAPVEKEFVDSDGMRWSKLFSIQGSGVTNCGTSRINNQAWERCEAWAEKKNKQKSGLKAVIKDVELYNIASENERGPSWDPKQSCTFHATLKCGYKLE